MYFDAPVDFKHAANKFNLPAGSITIDGVSRSIFWQAPSGPKDPVNHTAWAARVKQPDLSANADQEEAPKGSPTCTSGT